MPEIDRGDVTLHYEVDGAGPPLVLHAGMFSDSATWAPLVPLLTPHFTVIRPDNRATGRTLPHDAPVSAHIMVDDVLALMDHLDHDKFAIAGHSMGGLMAMEIASHAAARVTSISVLASGRVRLPRTMAVFDALLAVRRAENGETLWLRALYPWIFGQAFFEDPDNIETALEAALAYPHAQTVDAMAHQIEMFRSFRPQADVSRIACPTLVIYAGQDLLVPPSIARPGFAPVANLTEATIDHAGHSIVWDAPAEVAGLLLDFKKTA